MKRLFGTDGIRGVANEYPINFEVCSKLATAIYLKFLKNEKSPVVLIGKDTRLSGDMLEHAMASTFCSLGVTVKLLDVIPTPAVSILVKKWNASFGVMISASHNPYYDNGIKLFDSCGMKLSDDQEIALEDLISGNSDVEQISQDKIGRVLYFGDIAKKEYCSLIENFYAEKSALTKDKKIVIDSANGSLSYISSEVFKNLGFNVISLHDTPNGININDNCGVMHPETLKHAVLQNNADFGIAFDGDGDRVIICDEKGGLFNGDELLAILSLQDSCSEVVATIMSNFGFEHYLKESGIKLIRTNVGDRYISEYMKDNVANIGGETSGHIVIKSHAPTGDGLFAGLNAISHAITNNVKMSSLHLFEPYPTISENLRVKDKSVISDVRVVKVIEDCKNELGDSGRLIVRPSGTEPLIRITAEGNDLEKLTDVVNRIKESIEQC